MKIILLITLTSCTVMYKPNMSNVPMILEKGEMQASASWEDLQFAYAPFKSVAFTLNGQYKDTRPQLIIHDEKTTDYRIRNSCIDGAIGFYTRGPKASLEFFTGFGKGFSSLDFRENGYPAGGSSHYSKFYFQPDVVLGTTKEVKVALSLRVTAAHFPLRLKSGSYPWLETANATFIEPSVTIRQDYRFISLLGQMQYSAIGNEEDFESGHFVPFHDRLAIRFALQFQLHKIVARL